MFLFTRGIANCYTKPTAWSYNDFIMYYPHLEDFPASGSVGIIYSAMDTQLNYRWSGTSYVLIPQGPTEVPIPPVYTYPIGTSDVYGADGAKLSNINLALKWHGDYGLIKKFWSNRINWEMNIKKLIKTELLSEDIAKIIDMDEWKRLGDDNYLVNSFEIAIEGSKARLQNVELLKL
jgi:hypothetical protein